MAWLARLDSRAAQWPLAARWPYLALKWALVLLGAAALTFNYVQKWGWAASAWLLLAPVAYGIWKGWPTGRPPSQTL